METDQRGARSRHRGREAAAQTDQDRTHREVLRT